MHITIDGATFDIIDEGRGPAIVLLHGFPLANSTWDAQAAALARNARAVRFDLRGLGATTATPGPYLMEALAGDVLEILDALGIARAAIVGHSLGGYVAFAFYRMFAERCAALGIVCSRASSDDAATVETRLTLAAHAEAEGMSRIVEAFVPRYFAPAFYAQQPDRVTEIEALCARTDPRGAAAMLRGMAARVASDDLFDEIDIPTTVVAGSLDRFFDVSEARAIAENVRGAELDILDCGHMPQWEAADALTASLERLLERVPVAR